MITVTVQPVQKLQIYPGNSMDIDTEALLAALAPLGGGFFDRASQMEAAGFDSFKPLLAFTESFCSAPSDVLAHRKYIVELAKERVANPFPYFFLRDTLPGKYRSRYLSELRESRARTGNSFETCDPAKRWLIELNPCRLAELKLNLTSPEEYDRRRRPFLEEHYRLRQKEIGIHSTAICRGLGFEKEDRIKLCKEVIKEILGAKGYTYDAPLSRRPHFVFSKPLALPWCLCWTLDGSQLHRPVGVRSEDQIGYVKFILEVRPIVALGQILKKQKMNGVRISYNYAAPIDGAEWGYERFSTLQELETVTRAHLFAYGMYSDCNHLTPAPGGCFV